MLKKRVGKRGMSELLLFIMQLVIPLVFIGAFSLWIYNLNQSNYMEKQYALRDLPLTTDTVLAAPNNLYFTYCVGKLGDFNYTFSDQTLDIDGAKAYYADDLFFGKLNEQVEKPFRGMEFDNSGGSLIIRDVQEISKQIKIPYLDTQDQNWFDKEIKLEGTHPAITGIDKNIKPYKITSGQPDIYLELDETEGNDLIAWIDFKTAEQSRKLASILINKIIHGKDVGKINIFFTNTPAVREAGVILKKGKDLQIAQDTIKTSFGEYYG